MRFYEKVRVTDLARTDEFVGQIGIVTGIGEDEGHGASYAVRFPDSGEEAMFWEYELASTGVVVDESEVYGDEESQVIRVVVDKDGSGEAVTVRPAPPRSW